MATASLGIEKTLWTSADKLSNNMDAAEYKHVVLGLLFLKYVSDSFEDKYNELKEDEYADVEDKDEYLADNIYWVPENTRWEYISEKAISVKIGEIID